MLLYQKRSEFLPSVGLRAVMGRLRIELADFCPVRTGENLGWGSHGGGVSSTRVPSALVLLVKMPHSSQPRAGLFLSV